LYKRICPLLHVISIGCYINFQQYVSVICAISDWYYHGAEPAFSSSRPLLLSVPIPSHPIHTNSSVVQIVKLSLLQSGPHIQLSGERRKLSRGGAGRGGAQTDNALCTRKTSYRSRVSNTSRVFNRSHGQRRLLLEVLRYNVNVNVNT